MSELNLRVHDADPARVEQIRARCVSALDKQRRAAEARRARASGWRTWLEPAIAVGVGVLYVADTWARALAFFR